MLRLLRGIHVQRSLTNLPLYQALNYSTSFSQESELRMNENLITVPLKLKKKLDQKMVFQKTMKYQKIRTRERQTKGSSKLVIECRHPEFNHYRGQSYARHLDVSKIIATKGWAHRKSQGDFIKIRPLDPKGEGFEELDESLKFEDLGIDPEIVKQLESQSIKSVATIQSTAIPAILKGGHFLLTAETGCGKTLAYLLPIFQNILKEKKGRSIRGLNHPYAYVISPSRDLAHQIFEVAQSLAQAVDIKVKYLQGGNTRSKVRNPPSEEVDLVISTVDIANAFNEEKVYDFKGVRQVVIDEADTLLDDSFSDETIRFLRRFNYSEDEMQAIFVSATMPKDIENTLQDVIPMNNFHEISSPSLHTIHPNVKQNFLRLRRMDKPDKLLEILRKEFDLKAGIKIFCNKTSTCLWMRNFLALNSFDCVSLNSSFRARERRGILDEYNKGETNIIICTDLGSRGIDCRKTRHVINYDFPISLADYIHRCGRTGRLGGAKNCEVTNFISSPNEVPLLQEIETAIRKEMGLKDIDGNIKKLLNQKYGMYETIDPILET